MISKKHIFNVGIIILFATGFNSIIHAKKSTKGSTVTQTKAGQILDLSTFSKHASGIMFKVLKVSRI